MNIYDCTHTHRHIRGDACFKISPLDLLKRFVLIDRDKLIVIFIMRLRVTFLDGQFIIHHHIASKVAHTIHSDSTLLYFDLLHDQQTVCQSISVNIRLFNNLLASICTHQRLIACTVCLERQCTPRKESRR